MSQLIKYSLIMILSSLISAFSQVLLKKAAMKTYPSKIREYVNFPVITAYGIFFGCTLLSMLALKVVPLYLSPILEASGYVFTAVLGYVFFKEMLTKRQLLGMALILAGIVICALGAGT